LMNMVNARRKTRKIHVGAVAIGGDAPVAVQSMTNTDTRDVASTVAQVEQLFDAGCEIAASPCRIFRRLKLSGRSKIE
jgi:(E)-4-hydroxy-3-methylbut-2-enyl-diphosphate synthase